MKTKTPSATPLPTRPTGFVAYPSHPKIVSDPIRAAIAILKGSPTAPSLTGWEENDIAGRFIIEPILSKIDQGNLLVADITRLNFNVVFEIGYAIGRRKRVVLTRNASIT